MFSTTYLMAFYKKISPAYIHQLHTWFIHGNADEIAHYVYNDSHRGNNGNSNRFVDLENDEDVVLILRSLSTQKPKLSHSSIAQQLASIMGGLFPVLSESTIKSY